MKPEDKFAYASTSGICTMFVSCVGLNIKEDFSNSSSVFFDPIMCASAISGLVITILVFIGITLYECYKEHKDTGMPFGKIFHNRMFSKEGMVAFIVAIVVSAFVMVLGLVFIGLAIFFLPLLKGKFK